MTALVDTAAERACLRILWEECVTFGAARGKELLHAADLRAADFTADIGRTLFERLSASVALGRTPICRDLPEADEHLSGEDVLSPAALDAHAHVVRDLAQRRAVAAVAQRLYHEARESELSVSELIAMGERELKQLPVRGSRWEPLTRTLGRVQEHLVSVREGNKHTCIATGFPAIDAETGGLPPTLIVIAAMPGVGKSAFEASIIRNMALRQETAAIFCMEDKSEWLGFRLLAHESHVHQFVLRNKPLDSRQWNDVNENWSRVEALGPYVLCDDRPMLTPAEVLSSSRQAIKAGAKAIFLDNMTAMRFQRGMRMDLEIQDFLTSARALADETGVPFVVLSHVKRREELDVGDLPKLTDCSETSAFEKLSRLAYGLCRERKTERLIVGVLKNTNGKAYVKVALNLVPSSALVEAELRNAGRMKWDIENDAA